MIHIILAHEKFSISCLSFDLYLDMVAFLLHYFLVDTQLFSGAQNANLWPIILKTHFE